MKTKFIVASSIGLLGVTSMLLGATAFADNTGNNMRGRGSATKMTRMHDNMMSKKFTSTGDAEAFRTAVQNAMTNKDFAAFKTVHAKYNIPMNITESQFNEMIAVKSEMDTLHKKITDALKSGDYAAWKLLNKDTPLLNKIDTEAKFKQLQEMESYQEKVDSIATTLNLKGPQTGFEFGMRMDKGMRNHNPMKGGMMKNKFARGTLGNGGKLGMYTGNNN
ncbi:MAG: hypothetical protein NTY80_02585 [candidate division SR1 bacterium]|nr:hypothetical protein [candidate division SR1 bacterium]